MLEANSFKPNEENSKDSLYNFAQSYDVHKVSLTDESAIERLRIKNHYEIEKYATELQVQQLYEFTLAVRNHIRSLKKENGLTDSDNYKSYTENLNKIGQGFADFFAHKYNTQFISDIKEEEIKTNLFDLNLKVENLNRDFLALTENLVVLDKQTNPNILIDPLESNFSYLEYSLRESLRTRIKNLDRNLGMIPSVKKDLEKDPNIGNVVVHFTSPSYLKDTKVVDQDGNLQLLDMDNLSFKNDLVRIYATEPKVLEVFISQQKNALDLLSQDSANLYNDKEEQDLIEASIALRKILKENNLSSTILTNDSFSLDKSIFFPYKGKTFSTEDFKSFVLKETLSLLKDSIEKEQSFEEGSNLPVDINVIRTVALDPNRQRLILVKLPEFSNNLFLCNSETRDLVKVLNQRVYLYVNEHSPFYLLNLLKEDAQDLSSVGSKETNIKFIVNNLPEADLALETKRAAEILDMRLNQENTPHLVKSYSEFQEKIENPVDYLIYRANDELGNVLSTQFYGTTKPKILVHKNLIKLYLSLVDSDAVQKDRLLIYNQKFAEMEEAVDRIWFTEEEDEKTIPELIKSYADLQKQRLTAYQDFDDAKLDSIKRRLGSNIEGLNKRLNRTLDALAYFDNAQIVFLARRRIAELYQFKQNVSSAIYNDDEQSKTEAVDLGFAVYQGGYKGSDDQMLNLVFDNYKDFDFYQKREISDLAVDDRIIDDYNKKLANLYFENADEAIELLRKIEEQYTEKDRAKLYQRFEPNYFDYSNRQRNAFGIDSSVLADRLGLTNFLQTNNLSKEEEKIVEVHPETKKQLDKIEQLYQKALIQDVLDQIYPKSALNQNSNSFAILPKTLQQYSESTKTIDSFQENTALQKGLLYQELRNIEEKISLLDTQAKDSKLDKNLYKNQKNALLFQKELLVSIETEAFKRSNFSKPVWDQLINDPSFQQRYLDKNFSNTFQKSVQNFFLSKFRLEKDKLVKKNSKILGTVFQERYYKDFSRYLQAKLVGLDPEEERTIKRNRSEFFTVFIKSTVAEEIDLKTYHLLEKNVAYSKFFEQDLTDKEQESISNYLKEYKELAESIDQSVELTAIKNSILPLLDYNNRFFVSESLDTRTLSNQYLLTQSMIDYANLLDRSTEVRKYNYILTNKTTERTFDRSFQFAYDTKNRGRVDKLLGDNFFSYKDILDLYKIKSTKIQEEYVEKIEERDELIKAFDLLESFDTKKKILKDPEKLEQALTPVIKHFRKDIGFFLDGSREYFDFFINNYAERINTSKHSLKETKNHLRRKLLESFNYFLDLNTVSSIEGKIELGEEDKIELPDRIRTDYFVDFSRFLYENHYEEQIQKEKEEFAERLKGSDKVAGFFHKLEGLAEEIKKERSEIIALNNPIVSESANEDSYLSLFEDSYNEDSLDSFVENLSEQDSFGVMHDEEEEPIVQDGTTNQEQDSSTDQEVDQSIQATKPSFSVGALENAVDYADFGSNNEVIEPLLALSEEFYKVRSLREKIRDIAEKELAEESYKKGLIHYLHSNDKNKVLTTRIVGGKLKVQIQNETVKKFLETSGTAVRELKRIIYRDLLHAKQEELQKYLEFFADQETVETNIQRGRLLRTLLKNVRSFSNVQKIVNENKKRIFGDYLESWMSKREKFGKRK